MLPLSSPPFRSRLASMAAVVLALLWLAAPSFARIRPYTEPGYRQPKQVLKRGMSMGRDAKHEYHPKQGRNYAISRNGIVPQFQKPQFHSTGSRVRARRG